MTAEKVKIDCSEIKELVLAHLPEIENSFSESESCLQIIEGHYEDARGIELLSKLLDKIEEIFEIKIRDRMDWMDMSVKKWSSRISYMVMENRMIQTKRIGPSTVLQYLNQNHGIVLDKKAVSGSAQLFADCVNETRQFFGKQDLFGILSMLIDHFYLDLSPEEIEDLNCCGTMDEVYELLNMKLSQRKVNDCKAYYSRNWSLKSRQKTREIFSGTVSEGVCLKHLSGKHGSITLEKNVFQSADSGTDSGQETVLGLPLCIRESRDGRLYEYWSIEELLDDGWVTA